MKIEFMDQFSKVSMLDLKDFQLYNAAFISSGKSNYF